jgi:hypothetical protein
MNLHALVGSVGYVATFAAVIGVMCVCFSPALIDRKQLSDRVWKLSWASLAVGMPIFFWYQLDAKHGPLPADVRPEYAALVTLAMVVPITARYLLNRHAWIHRDGLR